MKIVKQMGNFPYLVSYRNAEHVGLGFCIPEEKISQGAPDEADTQS